MWGDALSGRDEQRPGKAFEYGWARVGDVEMLPYGLVNSSGLETLVPPTAMASGCHSEPPAETSRILFQQAWLVLVPHQ